MFWKHSSDFAVTFTCDLIGVVHLWLRRCVVEATAVGTGVWIGTPRPQPLVLLVLLCRGLRSSSAFNVFRQTNPAAARRLGHHHCTTWQCGNAKRRAGPNTSGLRCHIYGCGRAVFSLQT